jgi:spore coat protein A, manganese oxidase
MRTGRSTLPSPATDGDGKTDPAVYRNGVWYLLRSSQGFTGVQFGISTDLPAPADFDGAGKSDAAVFRHGRWYLLQSINGFTAVQFGITNDKPIPNSFIQ